MMRSLFLAVLACFSVQAQKVTVTVLATTDLHGNLLAEDYFSNRPMPRGLAKIASLVREVRAQNPNTLLIDCGDTIQGSPLEYVYQSYVRQGQLPLGLDFAGAPLAHDPMMLAMNYLRYDAMTLGNHEFNYGLKNLNRARAEARFPWLSANTTVAAGGAEKPFAPYIVKTVAGMKVAIIGITTPAIPAWEKPENYGSYRFHSGRAAVEKAIADLRAHEKPDLIIAAVHAGIAAPGSDAEENMTGDIAEHARGLDAIFFGHTHQEVEERRIGDVLLVQPKNWGISLGRMDFAFDAGKLVSKRGRVVKVTENTPADPEIVRMVQPYEQLTQQYLNTPVAAAAQPLDGRLGRVEDTPLLDAIQTVQLHYAKADVSFASMFNPRVSVPQGSVTVRQLAALYIYDNELYTIEGTGKMVKDALENAARYFLTCADRACKPPLVNPRVMGFNYDIAQGVSYEVDLTRPEGDRIRNLTWKGKPLAPDQKLRLAVNNYRAGGSAGYTMFAKAKVLWRSGTEIRDLMIEYYTHKKLPAEADGNWRIVPGTALHTLEAQALADSRGANLF